MFLINSPLHPWLGTDTGTDSSVFKTLALQMEKGLIPYKDSFDHKGPLIYILNYWGNKISYYRGIWLIEFLFMTITFFMIYKIARLSCSIKNSFFVMLVSISLLFGYFEGGNLTEEYAMPFIAIAIYYFVDYLKNNKISKLRILISGINLGCILLLRPNMIAVWFVFCIAIFILSIRKQDWVTLVKKIPYIYQNRNIENNSGQVNTIIGIIDKYTEKDENISVYGNWNIIYVLSQRKPASIYSYQFPIGQVMPEIMDKYLEQLQEELPPIIVIQQGIYPDNNMNNFLKVNEYKIIWGEEGKSAESALVYLR